MLKFISEYISKNFEVEIFEDLASIHHFNLDLDNENLPDAVVSFRNKIVTEVLICTPEYVFLFTS
ncbi:hypothetical protein [Flavobacterium sp. ALJ2]|uniref:hypothetical protein n=1 Tax=Flavobacterium sp. ALJ2 TaxID=2786960 RepID=UPI0032219FFA